MHQSVIDLSTGIINRYKLAESNNILELGAQNVNGSLRPLLETEANSYTGVDFQAGPGVDIVGNAHDISDYFRHTDSYGADKYDKFDLIVCTEMIEHDDEFWVTMWEINILLKTGGYLLLTCRGVNHQNNEAMFEHGFPYDYWRPMRQGFIKLFELANCEPLEIEADTQHPGWLGLGRKK